MNGLGDYDRWKCDPDWGVRDEPEDRYEYDDDDCTECIGPRCLFAGEHERSECFTLEMCEAQEREQIFGEHPELLGLIESVIDEQANRLDAMRYDVIQEIRRMARRAHECGRPLEWCGMRCELEPGHGGECYALPF